MRAAGYLAACLLVPAVWGFFVAWLYDRLAARSESGTPAGTAHEDAQVPMYYI